MSKINKISIIIIVFLIFILFYGYKIIQAPLNSNSELKIFTVNIGEPAKKVAYNLEKEHLIKDSSFFLLYLFLTNNNKNIQAGEYLLSPQMSIIDLTKIITKGEINKKYITILEGWNLNDIAKYFEEKGIATKEEFYNLVGYPKEIKENSELNKLIKNFSLEKPNNISLEGYIFPDTYNVNNGDTAETIVLRSINNWNEKITDDLRIEIKNQNKSIFEIITMASIIEKEAKTLEDKKIVSAIFWKRIEAGIPLQSCPTVLYSLKEEKTQVSTEDTQVDSPYNTYKYRGLPIGPISNPGMDSIIAAIYPTQNNYWYFLSDTNGNLHFSKTLEEHNQNKYKYLK
ncbi:MAG: endolytic transglycosylase MltG [Candidatus Pacebacteria bacterium]|nr:endolytic transglycosylase MltG [Candidatus Paceibacterota bacterium]MDD4074060.1 endolytic transglycosylase MltG [Candidatus Paceibacterota bacterium]